MKALSRIWTNLTFISRSVMWIEGEEREKERQTILRKPTMLHASSRVPSHPTTLEFLNVIFLFCFHSLYERNFYLLLSFPEPRPSCLPRALCVARTFLMPFLSPSLRGRSQNHLVSLVLSFLFSHFFFRRSCGRSHEFANFHDFTLLLASVYASFAPLSCRTV